MSIGVSETAGSKKEIVVRSKLVEGVNAVDDEVCFQSLVAEELESGKAVWIDVGNESSTYRLAGYSEELLERVEIGRAFTPFQHHQLVHQLEEFVDEDTGLLVLPNIDFLYFDQLSEPEAEELFSETWEKVRKVQKEYGLKLVVSSRLQLESDNRVEVEETGQGRRYSSREFETRFYRENGLLQTTLHYWNGGERNGKDERHVQEPPRQSY